ncbi:serine proteinase stubble isoform X2 [Periplaneta americana]
MSCVPQGALLALLAAILHCAMTSPVWMPQFLSGGSGRNIRHLPCISRRSGETGVCMFAFSCMKANGTHLGTCIDRFYFGSCCKIDSDNTEDNYVLPPTSTTESKYYLSTFQSVEDSDNRVEPDDDRPVKPITKKPSLPDKKPTGTTRKPATQAEPLETTTKRPVTHVDSTKTTTSQTTTRKPVIQTKPPETTTRKPVTHTKPSDTTSRKPVTKPSETTTTIKPQTSARPSQTTTKIPVTETKPTHSTTRKPVTQTTTRKPATQTTTKKPIIRTTRKPITETTTRKPATQTTPRKPITETTTRKPATQTTPRKPVTQTKPAHTTTNPVTQTKPPQTTTRPATPSKSPETTTRKPDIQTKPPQLTTQKPATEDEPPQTTTRKPVTQAKPTQTTTRKPVTQTKPTSTTTRKPVTYPKPPQTTRKPATHSKPTQTTTRAPVTQPIPPVTTKRPVIQTKPSEPTTKRPVTLTKPQTTSTLTTTKVPVFQTWHTDKPLTPTEPPTTTRKPVTTTKKPVVTTTRKPPTKKPTVKTTTELAEELTTTTAPASLITWTMLQEPPRTEAATITTTSDGWVLVPITTHPPSVDSTAQTGTSTPAISDMPPDVTTTTTVGAAAAAAAATTTTTTTTTPTTMTQLPLITTTTTMTTTATSSPPEVASTGTDEIDLNMTDFRQVCGRRLFPESRIVGGEKSTFGKWPWQISLRQWRTSTYLHKCGAALLNENWAITAAHCVENVPPSDLLLRLGEHDLSSEEEPYGYQERRVQIVASHPQFDPRTFEYDLALLRFYEPVTFQPNILPVCVPHDDTNFVGHTAYVTGWGRLYEDGPLPSVLQEVSVPVINNSVCETMYRSAGYIEHIPEIFICAGWRKGGFDSCEGDSGGPMVIQRPDKRWLLAGVISWGIGCAEPNQPGVYTRISEFREWINQILQF